MAAYSCDRTAAALVPQIGGGWQQGDFGFAEMDSKLSDFFGYSSHIIHIPGACL